ncbi:MAG: sialidase family protein [Akkermansiaceae bacterium]
MKLRFTPLAALFLTSIVSHAEQIKAPYVVAVPPADAGRGLIRVSEKEIRHYPGKGGKHMLQSLDNGKTWKSVPLPKSYPGATCLSKESPAIARNPVTGEFIRFEPLYRGNNNNDGIYITEGGIDGSWKLVRDNEGKAIRPGGILRNPLWVNNNKRIIIPGHGGGCWTWYSDDQGQSWKRSNKVQSPPHKPGGVHKGTRWNHGMVEATVIELKNKKLWMIARTAQDQHYESFSSDFGETWSKAELSRFWGTITMPTLHRLRDGRMLFLWSNTTALPENEKATGRGEDAFTNRDTIHAAISEDDGKTWIGFRELILDKHRNRSDYGTFKGKQDRGKHQAEVVQLDDNRVLYSCGQHAEHRRLMIMDLRWLYEKKRNSDLAKDGTKDWTTHQYIQKYVGHCAYNRTPGAQVKDGALRVLRVDDPSLDNQSQGATWNFASGHTGLVSTKIRLEKGNQNGIQITLTDRWFNAADPSVSQFANYLLKLDKNGKTPTGKQILTPGKTHELTLIWNDSDQKGQARLKLDGRMTTIKLPQLKPCPNGISYIHFYNPATSPDPEGFSIFNTHAQIK